VTIVEDIYGNIQLVIMGHLLDDLPAGGEGFSGENFAIRKSMTVLDLARMIGLGDNAEFFVMINDEHLPNDVWESRFLQPEERVVLCPPLKGG
jgi:sulfur carrier protein ThiS